MRPPHISHTVAKVICHVCNDIGRWGQGFVMALSKAFPKDDLDGAYKRWYARGAASSATIAQRSGSRRGCEDVVGASASERKRRRLEDGSGAGQVAAEQGRPEALTSHPWVCQRSNDEAFRLGACQFLPTSERGRDNEFYKHLVLSAKTWVIGRFGLG